ncbi:MAG: stimulus-sensing domain-containing protein [Alphaproteobacteria bacterium]|nr:stimulus-sensing domain-containing protein [Alphaproteobacteria bacterium]
MALATEPPPPRLDPRLGDVDDEPAAASAPPLAARDEPARGRPRWRSPLGSPLTRRILAVNVLPLLILVAGLLYVGEYRKGLVQAELDALRTQAALIANALGEGTIDRALTGEDARLAIEPARHMVRRLVEPTGARARLFGADGALLADTRLLSSAGGSIYIERLEPPDDDAAVLGTAGRIYGWIVDRLPQGRELPLYQEREVQTAADYAEVARALEGEVDGVVRRDAADRLILSVAVPVQRYKQVLGAVMLSADDQLIRKAIRSVRFDILKVFAVALAITVLLSLYLGGTIVRPILRLARAAERVKRGQGRPPVIPEIRRRDEIAHLAASLRTMTQVLWQRLNANERFAADVAHEIKNPLTSLRSAVETAARVKDPDQQRRLMAIIQEDVGRLDRLITDISDASRLDAELSRDATEAVDVARLLDALAELHTTTDDGSGPRFRVDVARHQDLAVTGLESRLGQVLRNLIANAVSFSPPGGTITLRAARRGPWVVAQVEDEGPGIPDDKLETIFSRFYSERPSGEKFGTHSGLGLSISKQIVEAHGGTIVAENRRSGDRVTGARFTVSLPAGHP